MSVRHCVLASLSNALPRSSADVILNEIKECDEKVEDSIRNNQPVNGQRAIKVILHVLRKLAPVSQSQAPNDSIGVIINSTHLSIKDDTGTPLPNRPEFWFRVTDGDNDIKVALPVSHLIFVPSSSKDLLNNLGHIVKGYASNFM